MSDSIIVGIVVGVLVALVSGYISHYLRQREMKALWAEEQRRRKSDRRREVYERELKIVSDAVDAVVEAMPKARGWAWVDGKERWKSRVELMRELDLVMGRAHLVALSLEDLELMQKNLKLVDGFQRWFALLDLDTGKVVQGKEAESTELMEQTLLAASEVWRRIREILLET